MLGDPPISSVLNCAIELWSNLEIDDDELLELAIRDVSYQIQLQKEREELTESTTNDKKTVDSNLPSLGTASLGSSTETRSFDGRHRFNRRVDPTGTFLSHSVAPFATNHRTNSHHPLFSVLCVEMNRMTLNIDNFLFRIEKGVRTIFDPVF